MNPISIQLNKSKSLERIHITNSENKLLNNPSVFDDSIIKIEKSNIEI